MKPLLVMTSIVALAALSACQNESSDAAGKTGAASTATAAADRPAAAASVKPSFDCAKAQSEAEKLVCSDAQLAQLDNEVDRLFKLAEKNSYLTAATKAELVATQRGWIKGRDDCWKADDKKNCVAGAYAQRAMELRSGNANARSDDASGISSGPVLIECEGFDASIGAVFVRSDPGMVYLEWLDRGVALVATESASGVKYVGSSFDGEYTLWTKGTDAIFNQPGKPDLKCKQGEIG